MSTTEKNNIEKDETIDLRRLFVAVLRKLWVVILAAVICAGAAFVGTLYFVKPKYRSSALLYVNGNALSVGSISISDLTAAKDLVNSYIVILQSRETLNAVKDYAGIDYDATELRGMISAASVNDTEIFEVYVTSTDPYEAEKIANAIAVILPKRIESIIDGATAKIVDSAVVPSAPYSPNYTKNAALGFICGALLVIAIVIIRDILDTTIRTADDISSITSLPVLAAVPDMSASGGARNKKKRSSLSQSDQLLVGDNISFAAIEANKLLRTKLLFSFADSNSGRVIGVSSSITGEGKTLTSVNLAYSLSQLKKRVLLIDCDLRRPSIYRKLSINKSPGLSEYLTGQFDKEDVINSYNFTESALGIFDVITSGKNPPNPMELISSEKMRGIIKESRDKYDYVIIDLPPIGEVSDALAVADYVDGMLLVVRQDYCDRPALSDAISQFEFVNSKVIGFVLNCSNDEIDAYGKYKHSIYGKYSKYSKNRKYGYGSYRKAYIATVKKSRQQNGDNN